MLSDSLYSHPTKRCPLCHLEFAIIEMDMLLSFAKSHILGRTPWFPRGDPVMLSQTPIPFVLVSVHGNPPQI